MQLRRRRIIRRERGKPRWEPGRLSLCGFKELHFFSATLLFPTIRSNLGLDEQVQYSEEIIVIKRHVRHERLTEIKRSKAGWREIGIEICIYSKDAENGGSESVESVR